MTEGRCASCKHWSGPDDGLAVWGTCRRVTDVSHGLTAYVQSDRVTVPAWVKTSGAFGCGLWEAKPVDLPDGTVLVRQPDGEIVGVIRDGSTPDS